MRKFWIVSLLICFALGCCTQHLTSGGVQFDDESLPVRKECEFQESQINSLEKMIFRPFEVYMPTNVANVDCCCLGDGSLFFDTPDAELCVIMFPLCYDDRVINDKIELYAKVQRGSRRSISSDEDMEMCELKRLCGNVRHEWWYMVKEYQDRRILMEHFKKSSGENVLYCYCELTDGVSTKFVMNSNNTIDMTVCKWLWQLCQVFQIKVKYIDSNKRYDPLQRFERISQLRRNCTFTGGESQEFEWKHVGSANLYSFSNANVGQCHVHGQDHYVLDLPNTEHYVTIQDDVQDVIDNKIELYGYLEMVRNTDTISNLTDMVQCAVVLGRQLGIDWYIEERCLDRRLLIEHSCDFIGVERLKCYCAFADGRCILFEMRGVSAIDNDAVQCFWSLCRKFAIID